MKCLYVQCSTDIDLRRQIKTPESYLGGIVYVCGGCGRLYDSRGNRVFDRAGYGLFLIHDRIVYRGATGEMWVYADGWPVQG